MTEDSTACALLPPKEASKTVNGAGAVGHPELQGMLGNVVFTLSRKPPSRSPPARTDRQS